MTAGSTLAFSSRRRSLLGATAAAGIADGHASAAGGPAGVALALGSGSLHGYAHLGVLKAFDAHGVRPRIVTGTSAGAIAGALWAHGLNWEQVHRATADLGWWRNQRLALNKGLLRNHAVGELVTRRTAGVPVHDWPTRFAAVATDFSTGERVILSAGAAGPIVQASSSVPVLYAPVPLNGRQLVDGGLSEPVPIRAARQLGARFVIAVDIAFRPAENEVSTLAGTALHAVHILVNRLIEEQIAEADLAIRLDVHRFVSKERSHAELIEAGERAVEERWTDIAALFER